MARHVPPAHQAIPNVVYVSGDVTEAATLTPDKMAGCDALVHLVGIIQEAKPGQTFEAVHVRGTQNVLTAARAAGAGTQRFIYLSALGSTPDAASAYSRTKAAAEQAVRDSGLPFTIFRPSVILGPDGEFVAQMEDLIREPPLSPVPLPFVPVPGNGTNKFQPVWIGDLVACLVQSLTNPATINQVYEIGGATPVSFNELLQGFGRHLGVKKPLLHAPLPLMRAAAWVLQAALPQPPITTDQLLNLQRDNVCDNSAIEAACGVRPLGFEQALARVYAERQR
jgi:NADH dehydrogenase